MSITESLAYLHNNLMDERKKLLTIVKDPPHCRLVSRRRKNGIYNIYIRYDTNDPNKPYKDVFVNRSLRSEAAQISRYMLAKIKLNDVNNTLSTLEAFRKSLDGPSSFNTYMLKHPWIQSTLSSVENSNDKLMQWKNKPYDRNWKHLENIRYSTIVPGLSVRSKSEADIVSRLEFFNIPYHYDEIIDLNGVRINMDFVCINVTTGKIWYWDHRGMLDNPSYIEKTLYCERQFLNAGIIPDINLITTSETSSCPLNLLAVDTKIRNFLL